MSRRDFLKSSKSGSILALMIIVIVLLSVMGVGMLQCGLQARVYAAKQANEIAAQVAADAGIERAIADMNTKLEVISTTSPRDISPALSRPDEEPLPNSNATYSYKVVANSILSVRDLTITSTGKCGPAEKTVYATVQRVGGPFEYAVFAQSGMTLKPNTMVDGYDSDNPGAGAIPVCIGTNSTKDASITIGGGAIVNGDVLVGLGGKPDVVVSADKATITGDTAALSEEQEFPSVTVPLELNLALPRPTITKPTVISGVVKYDGINLGVGETITINGPTKMYVTGNIGLGKSAAIMVSDEVPNSSLELYLGGDIYCKNGGMINNLTEDPKKLKIYALDSCDNMSFATAGVFYGAIYAPNSPIYLKSSLEIYGSVVADIFAQGSTSNLHYDASLEDEGAEFWPSRFEVRRWSEE